MKQPHALTRYILDMKRGIDRALRITDDQLLEARSELQAMMATPLRDYVITEINKKMRGEITSP